MLSKGQKKLMFILGVVAMVFGVVIAVPFRAVPGLNHVENIFTIEMILKASLSFVAILLAIYPMQKKYQLLCNYRENSKIALVMAYFPIVICIIATVVNTAYMLTFDYTEVGMMSVLSDKMLGIVIAVLVGYIVFSLYCLVRAYDVMMRLGTKGNIVLDVILGIVLVIFSMMNWKVNSAYSSSYQDVDAYLTGDPIVFFIYIGIIIGFGITLSQLIKMFKKDEVLVYCLNGDVADYKIKQKEYNRAYNDTLDDFELYYDENAEVYDNLEIVEVEEEKEVESISLEEEIEEDEMEIIETSVSPTLEEIDTNDSEEVKALVAEQEKVAQTIAQTRQALEELEQQKAQLEKDEASLRDLRATYEAAVVELHELKLQQTAETEVVEPETPVKKEKKIVPPFEKMIEFAHTFQTQEGFKVIANKNETLFKFYIGKKMCLVMQKTANDYRISFITTAKKFVDYLKSRPGELIAPKNLKDNYWVKLTNKGKEEAKFMRKVIKESFVVAQQQIAEELAEKERIKKEKAQAKAKERAAARAAAKQGVAK